MGELEWFGAKKYETEGITKVIALDPISRIDKTTIYKKKKKNWLILLPKK